MKKMKRHSYDIDRFRDPDEEARRLEHRAQARLEELIPELEAAGLRRNMQVLDLGAGTGTRSLRLARYLTRGQVTGIDGSEALLARARLALERARLQNLRFEKMDFTLTRLPAGRFDFAYVRLVVQHLKRPVETLENVKRSLKPGGVVFLEDTDREFMTFYPEPPEWAAVYQRIKDTQSRLGGDPRSGRKLAHHLAAAGFRDVRSRLVPVTGAGKVFEDWLANYAPTFFTNLPPRTAARGQALLRAMGALNRRRAVSFHQIWFQAWGRR